MSVIRNLNEYVNTVFLTFYTKGSLINIKNKEDRDMADFKDLSYSLGLVRHNGKVGYIGGKCEDDKGNPLKGLISKGQLIENLSREVEEEVGMSFNKINRELNFKYPVEFIDRLNNIEPIVHIYKSDYKKIITNLFYIQVEHNTFKRLFEIISKNINNEIIGVQKIPFYTIENEDVLETINFSGTSKEESQLLREYIYNE